MSTVTVIVGGGLAPKRTRPEIMRNDLQLHDPSAPGREQIIYVLAGSLEYQVEGRAPVLLTAGDVLFIPARTVD